jgi:glycerol-3-phosphate O-acyltransferase
VIRRHCAACARSSSYAAELGAGAYPVNTPIGIALWLLIVLALFAIAGVWLIVVAPLMTRAFYRRRERAMRMLDERLAFGLSNYVLARRSDWLDRLLNDTVVTAAIASSVAAGEGTQDAVRLRARTYVEEIVPSFSTLLYFRIGYWVMRWVLRALYWIRAEYSDREALGRIGRDSCVVLVSNHRSNVDPFLLIYLVSKRALISYSAGEWALIWPLRCLLHAIGAYIVRRDGSGDRLYRVLLERYVFLSAAHCVPQGLFLEGGLSRDGEMQPLKLGLLSYVLRALGHDHCRDIVFVPVGLSYDRIPEDRVLLAHREQGFRAKSHLYSLGGFLRFAVLMMPRMIGLGRPFGEAVANFGRPLSLLEWQAEFGGALSSEDPQLRRQQVTRLGEDLKARIAELIPVLPVSLIADVLLAAGADGLAELELKQRALARAAELRHAAVPVILNVNGEDHAFSQALLLLWRRRALELANDGRLRVCAAAGPLLEYYRNAIPAGRRKI